MKPDYSEATGHPISDPPSEREDSPYRWYLLLILTLVATLNGIDKHLMPAMAEPIKQEFGLSDTQFGFIAGFVYSLGFAIGGIPLTLLVDRVGRSRLLALLLAIWSGATALGSLVSTAAQLTVTRFIVGAAEVGGQPISMALIGDWFKPDRRGSAMGIWSISRSISLIVSFSVGGWIALHWGWRHAFLLAGIPGVVLSIIILFSLREANAVPPSVLGRKPVSTDIVRAFLGNRPLFLLAIALVLAVGCQNGVMAFLSSFLTRSYDLPVDRAGFYGGMILGVGAGVGMPLGGFITDLIGKHSVRRQFGVVAGLMFAALPAALIGLNAPTVVVAIAGLFVFELLTSCAYTAGLSTYLNGVPAAMRGSLSALLTILIIFAGAGLGPPVAGFASDSIGALHLGLSATSVLMLLGGILVSIGMGRLASTPANK